MPSYPDGLDHLRTLPRPVIFESDDQVARYRLHASNEEAVLVELESWMSAPPSGRRLTMHGTEGYLKAIALNLVVERTADPHWVIARWHSVAASVRPDYLAQVLHVLLGLKREVVVGVETLPVGEQVLWEARSDRIHRVSVAALRTGDSPNRSAAAADYFLTTEQLQRLRVVHPRPVTPLEIGKAKKLSRLHPVYPRDPARGYVSLGGERIFPAIFTAVGSSHCVFHVLRDVAPTLAAPVRIGIPLAPLHNGLVWLEGKVIDLRAQEVGANCARVHVEVLIDRTKAIVPVEYTQLMTHFREQPPSPR